VCARWLHTHENTHKHTNTDVTCLHCMVPDGMCLGPCVHECGLGLVERGSVDFVLKLYIFLEPCFFWALTTQVSWRDIAATLKLEFALHRTPVEVMECWQRSYNLELQATGKWSKEEDAILIQVRSVPCMYVCARVCARACVGHTSVGAHASGHGVRRRGEARLALFPLFSPPSLSVSPFKTRFLSTAASRKASA
jgi:hypothetical protein